MNKSNRTVTLLFISSLFIFLSACGGGNSLPDSGKKSDFNKLNIVFAGNGAGTVTIKPTGKVCKTTCSELFTNNTVVTLSYKAAAGSRFIGFGGNDDCSDNSVKMSSEISCSANFKLNSGTTSYDLNVILNGAGSVTSVPNQINCGAVCSAKFSDGTVVKLLAKPNTGNRFVSWSGVGCSTGSVKMDQSRSCTANFEQSVNSYSLEIIVAGNGTVTSSPLGIICGVDCNKTFDSGTVVLLFAEPLSPEVIFSNWGSDCIGITDPANPNLMNVTITSDSTCTVVFTTQALPINFDVDQYF